MRAGELRVLEWRDVDFEANAIHVRPKDGWTPKTGRSRTIAMHPRVRAVLEALPRDCRWVFTAKPSMKYPQGGHQVSLRHLLRTLKSILRHLGIEAGKLHTFRQFFISHCANSGVEPSKLMKWVGHSNLAVIVGYYSLPDEESQRTIPKVPFGPPA